MEISVAFTGGRKVEAQFGAHRVVTDQPKTSGGEGTAPAPFQLFLASIATCAAYYVLDFCTHRGISLEGLSLTQKSELDPETRDLTKVAIYINVPKDFPEKYHDALIRVAKLCKVKKSIEKAPEMPIEVRVAEGTATGA